MSISFHRPLTRLAAVGATLALVIGAAACGTSGSADSSTDATAQDSSSAASSSQQGSSPQTSPRGTTDGAPAALTVYTGQHEDLVKSLATQFTETTGIAITIRAGDDAELANQIIEEGAGSPADIFLSEEPGPVALLDTKDLLSPVDADTLGEVDQQVVPSSGNWMPYAARSRVIYYDPSQITPDQLPKSILDLSQPQWKGKFAYAPTGAFTATVSYLISSIGADKTLDWLEGIKANGVNEQKNGKVRDSVEAGQHAFGLSNHYYWWILANDKGGPDQLHSKIYYFDHPDAGGLLLASGAAVIKASAHQAEAQQFLAWLGSADGGQRIIASDPAAQYPVAPGVQSQEGLQPLSDLNAPDVDQSVFADTATAKDLIIKAGIA